MRLLTHKKVRSKKENYLAASILCIAGIMLNYGGSFISNLLNLPLYLDSAGTIISAMLGGYIPGIIVGLLTNILTSSFDSISISYGTLNVLIAVVAAFFFDRNFIKKVWGVVGLIISLSLIGGVLGSILTFLLYGFGGEASTGTFAAYILEKSGLSLFLSEMLADFLIDLLDKTIVVLISLLIVKLIPESIKSRLSFGEWKQAPLSKEAIRAVKKTDTRSVSLSVKLMWILTVAAILIGAVATGISYVLYKEANIETQKEMASSIARIASDVINGDMVESFMEDGEEAPSYKETEEALYSIKETAPDIEYLYVYEIEEDRVRVVFDLDTEDVLGAEPGSYQDFDEDFLPYIEKLKNGEKIDPVLSDGWFGSLLTAYEPVYRSDGTVSCYAAADISMERIKANGYSFLTRLISLFLGTLILILSFGLRLTQYNIIYPLDSMALTAGEYKNTNVDSIEHTAERFNSLEIKTGDEIENLYQTFSRMIEENLLYINDVKNKNQTINEMQRGLIMVLADLVESRDKNTGDHVRKTAEYVKIIMEEMKKEGIYEEYLTDKFMSDVYQSAPLHDVGKIIVSDVILNKPGKLTDEEFDIMKKHTTAGAEIIDRVLLNVPDGGTGYLKEARDLALYHHEKWNGQGYPTGLSGEDIPLSARIMAVADVFDALVSTRSYKKGFPFEKAIAIIEESSGSHFDPKIASAFLNAKEKARKVAEFNKEKEEEA